MDTRSSKPHTTPGILHRWVVAHMARRAMQHHLSGESSPIAGSAVRAGLMGILIATRPNSSVERGIWYATIVVSGTSTLSAALFYAYLGGMLS